MPTSEPCLTDPAARRPVERVPPSDLLRSTRAIAVLRATAAADYAPVIEVLVEAGIRSMELTLTTPGTLEVIESLVDRFAGRAEVGVGTVMTEDEAEQALGAGAAYLVTPTVNPAVVAVALRHRQPVYPGALSPTEVHTNWSTGASAVKVFPASMVGPGYLSALRGPMPDVATMPSGGVRTADIRSWLDAGAIAVSLGGELLGDAFRGGDPRALRERAEQVRAAVDGHRP